MVKLIADSGSTKTHWGLITANGHVKSYKSQGFNPYFQTAIQIKQVVCEELLPKLLPDEYPTQIYFYGAGCANEDKCSVVKIALQQCFSHASIVEVASDMLGAARSLCGSSYGVVAILGTGANSCYYDGKAIVTQTPSLGFILGDEGSGAYLGKALIKAYLYNELPAEISHAFKEEFALTKDIVVEAVYRKPFPNRYLASFVPFIKKHIEHGYLQNVVYYAFDAFLEHHIIKYPQFKNISFLATGSVAYHFSDLLQKVAANREIQVGIVSEGPMDGLLKYHC